MDPSDPLLPVNTIADKILTQQRPILALKNYFANIEMN